MNMKIDCFYAIFDLDHDFSLLLFDALKSLIFEKLTKQSMVVILIIISTGAAPLIISASIAGILDFYSNF